MAYLYKISGGYDVIMQIVRISVQLKGNGSDLFERKITIFLGFAMPAIISSNHSIFATSILTDISVVPTLL